MDIKQELVTQAFAANTDEEFKTIDKRIECLKHIDEAFPNSGNSVGAPKATIAPGSMAPTDASPF